MADAPDIFADWRAVTSARIGLGRAGQTVPTKAMLDFQIAHARARDAVHSALDTDALSTELNGDVVTVTSEATDRAIYLQNPSLGRRLADPEALQPGDGDVVIVLADGLSATALQTHGATIANRLKDELRGWSVGPFVIADQARVALGDDIGERMGAKVVIVLIGERPGLSAADSVGAYVTWAPKRGCPDSARNCVSNIRIPGGLPLERGAANIAWIVNRARELNQTGVGLKDRFADEAALNVADTATNQIAGESE